MIILLSCAKTMCGTSSTKTPLSTEPLFQKEATEIALQLTRYDADELRQMLHVNIKIAAENYNRYREFYTQKAPSLEAVLAYTGMVFKRLNPNDFTKEDFLYAQDHLRITSFCYGLLRPLDMIKNYRLEGDVVLPETGAENMYAFWKTKLTDLFIGEIERQGGILLNLASNEMKQLFDWKRLKDSVKIITPEFRIRKNGKLTTIVIYTKMSRGEMTRYVLKNKIENPEKLKAFQWEGFKFDPTLSDNENYTFVQE